MKGSLKGQLEHQKTNWVSAEIVYVGWNQWGKRKEKYL